jgi:outer membrane protein assembly factor BamB
MMGVVDRRIARAACGAALLVAACGAPTGPQPTELVPLDNPRPTRVMWVQTLREIYPYSDEFLNSAPIPEAWRFVFFPALVGEAIFATARSGVVLRLDAASGRERWRADAGTLLSGGVGADDKTVAVASEKGEVIALDAADGKVRWRARVSSEVFAAPTVGFGLVLVRSIDNRIFAFGADDGKRRWVYQRAPASLILRAPAGVAILGDTAFAGFSAGKLVALSLANGGQRWEATVSVPKGSTELERVSDVVGTPAVQGREVCAVAYQGRVGCYEAASGRQLWTRELSSATGVTLDARFAFVTDDRGGVHALDRSNGRSVWKQDKLLNRKTTQPLAGTGAIVVGDLEGFVHFLSRDSGAFVARFAGRGGPVRVAPLSLPSAALLVQTEDGGLYALAL